MQDWERFGEEIRRTVQDAVDSQDYRRLNQTITDTINRAVNSAVNGAEQGMRSFGNAFDQAARNMGRGQRQENSFGGGYRSSDQYGWNGRSYGQEAGSYGNPNRINPPTLYGSTTPAKAGGIVMTAVGGSLTLMFLTFFLVCCLTPLLGGPGILLGVRALLGAVTAGCGIVTAEGVKCLKRVGRFSNYSRAIGGREYCNISEICSSVGKSVKYVTKDLEKMIAKGWFKQGHMDGSKKCLMLTNRAYEEYLQIENRRQQAKMEETPERKEEKQPKEMGREKKELSPEVKKVIEQGDEFIQKIHACNEAIPGVEISAKISRMELLVDRIFDRVEENPQSVSDIHKLMEYYLPTTVKLLEAYEQLDRQPVGGENIQTAKREIEATLDTLNTAFEKLLDDLFQDTMWDVASDISVLNTMLAQEGLKEDGMKK